MVTSPMRPGLPERMESKGYSAQLVSAFRKNQQEHQFQMSASHSLPCQNAQQAPIDTSHGLSRRLARQQIENPFQECSYVAWNASSLCRIYLIVVGSCSFLEMTPH